MTVLPEGRRGTLIAMARRRVVLTVLGGMVITGGLGGWFATTQVQGSNARSEALIRQIGADSQRLASSGIVVSRWGPDHAKITVSVVSPTAGDLTELTSLVKSQTTLTLNNRTIHPPGIGSVTEANYLSAVRSIVALAYGEGVQLSSTYLPSPLAGPAVQQSVVPPSVGRLSQP